MKVYTVIIIIVSLYLGWIAHPALLHQLKGTFQVYQHPLEYDMLQNILVKDTQYSRVLWLPMLQLFGYYSDNHPAVIANNFFHESSVNRILIAFNQPQTRKLLQEAAIHYIVIPSDPLGEIFLSDNKYDKRIYQKTIRVIRKISWIKEVGGFKDIHVFVLDGQKDHFWINNPDARVTSFMHDTTKYDIELKHAKINDMLVFSEAYDPGWKLEMQGKIVTSRPYNRVFNSFQIPVNAGTMHVYYESAKWKEIGLIISCITFVSVIFTLSFYKKI